MRKLVISQTTAETFEEFGVVLSCKSKTPEFSDERFSWWEKVAVLKGIDPISLNILEAKQREFTVNELEFHRNTPEAIIPLRDEGIVLVLAPAGELDESKIKAFRVESGHGVVLHAGVRHAIPYPMQGNVPCLIMFKDSTGADDLTIEPLSQTREIVV
jgi:ureidoglycolate lyase